MKSRGVDQRVPGYRIQPTIEAVRRFRSAWNRHHKPQDINQLLRLFRKVKLEADHQLDYVSLGRGPNAKIWPFVRRANPRNGQRLPAVLGEIAPDQLMAVKPGDKLRSVEFETLYRHLSYDHSPLGLLEYSLFIPEMWALKSEVRAQDWLSLEPLVVRHTFDAVLRKAGSQLVRVARPDHYDPVVEMDSSGGDINFLAYQPGPWRRIIRLEIMVDEQGFVSWQTKEVVASLQRR